MEEIRARHICGEAGKMVPVRLLPGTDVMEGLKKVCNENGVRSAIIQSAIGSLRKLTIQILVPDEKAKLGVSYNDPVTVQGPVEVLAIQGVIFEAEETGDLALHLHGVFGDKEGNMHGGHLVPGQNPVLATLDAVIAEVSGVKFMRRYDEETALLMFSPEMP